MFLPSVERYSTVALAPTASLPSTVVLSSTRNCTVLASLFFATCTENSASPTDVICPDNDWLSGVGSRGPAAGWAAGGVDQAAIVKQTRHSAARHGEARNRLRGDHLSRYGSLTNSRCSIWLLRFKQFSSFVQPFWLRDRMVLGSSSPPVAALECRRLWSLDSSVASSGTITWSTAESSSLSI